MNMMQKFCIVFGFTILFAWITNVKACHNALDGSVGPEERKKRQAPEIGTVERTVSLREFFSDCLMERAGPMFDWNGVVDFSVLDTLWYEVTDEEECRNDTALCWQNRLEAYLRPNSVVLPFARDCISQLDRDVQAGRFGERRSKRSSHNRYLTTTQSPEEILMAQYSACVRSRLVIPRNRRRINVNSLVEFVEENAICGECSEIREPIYTPHYGYHGNRYLPTNRYKRSTRPISNTANSFRSLISSLASQFVQPNLTAYDETQCFLVQSFPFVFQGLTLESSPLFNPINSCNQVFRDQFLPNPCERLRNRKQDSFCEMQQSWCVSFPEYMNSSCERSCCERFNMPISSLPSLGWTEWTPWGACPAPCGRTAIQVRKRCCPLGEPGVAPCSGESRETRICRPEGCAMWSDWSPWSPCQVTCGGQTQISRRRCINGQPGDRGCTGMRSRVQMCARNKCPGIWTKWGSWSDCPVTCGGSNTYIHRTRSCTGGRVGELGCEGLDRERRECGREYCPPQWSDWSSWTECSFRKRVRHCVGGLHESCEGDSVVYERCEGCRQHAYPPAATSHDVYPSSTTTRYTHPHFYPTHGTYAASWLSWSHWSLCEGNCIHAVQRRRRKCQHVRRANSRCHGDSTERKRCTPFRCLFSGK